MTAGEQNRMSALEARVAELERRLCVPAATARELIDLLAAIERSKGTVNQVTIYRGLGGLTEPE